MEQMKEWYHQLHQIPEVALEEDQTRLFLKKELKKLGLTFTSLTGYDLLVYFDYQQDKTMAFRSEMDGLKIEEKTDLPYKSRRLGYMHACGHDGHMAILLGLAAKLKEIETCEYNVLLIFQMAEETIGGARMLCEAGIKELYKLDQIYTLHNMPNLNENCVYSREGPFLSSSTEINFIVYGKNAHVSEREQGIDSLKASIDLYQELSALMSSKKVCFHIGCFNSGTIRNGVSSETTLLATLRGFNSSEIENAIIRIKEVVFLIQQNYGVTIDLKIIPLYPTVVNSTPPISFKKMEKMTICDDFSWYLNEIKGTYFILGNSYKEPLHSSYYRFNENNLEAGLNLYLSLLNLR